MTTSTNATATPTSTSTTTVYKTIEDLIGPTLYIKSKSKPKSTSTKHDTKAKTKTGTYAIEPVPTASVLMKQPKKHVEYVLLYFSASWCPPCQSFTPILAELYQKYQNTMEIIYISSDRNIKEFEEYYGQKMPFATLHPFDTNASEVTTTLRQKLPQIFQISGLPTLVVLSIPPPDRDTTTTTTTTGIRFVTDQGRIDVMNHYPHSLDDVWKKWKSTPPLSIEEGVALSKRGDGSIGSIIMKLVQTLLQNPIYIFGIYYIIKFYGKSIYQMIGMYPNNTTIGTTSTGMDPSLLEPVPDDEF
jgi:nucleoredoxin